MPRARRRRRSRFVLSDGPERTSPCIPADFGTQWEMGAVPSARMNRNCVAPDGRWGWALALCLLNVLGCYESHLLSNDDSGVAHDAAYHLDAARDAESSFDIAIIPDTSSPRDLGGGTVDVGTIGDLGTDAGVNVSNDAAMRDAGRVDAGGPLDQFVPLDLAPPDLAGPDLAPPDVGPPDLGPPDVGLPDLGPPDLGPPDLGGPDLGAPDVGLPSCGAGLLWCDTACIDPAQNARHCGECGTACGTSVCTDGLCLRAHSVSVIEGATCAAITGGGVQCWGYNITGVLGDDTFVSRSRPEPVVGLEGVEVHSVSTSLRAACAMHMDGQVSCWGGRGGSPLLGDGTTGQRLTAAPISIIDDAVNFDTGYTFACAVRASGELWCWGEIAYGIYGPASMGPMRVPVRIEGIPPVTQVSAGTNYVCALTAEGPWCWGLNTSGKLGHGFASYSERPGPVRGLPEPVTYVSAGADHTCALGASGSAYCWGKNWFGEFGTGASQQQYVPTPARVARVPRLVRIEACFYRTCGIDEHGQAWCWGENNWGVLGVGSRQNQVYPARVVGATDVVDISCTNTDSCFVLADGQVLCAGMNYRGAHGDGTMTPHDTPVDVVW